MTTGAAHPPPSDDAVDEPDRGVEPTSIVRNFVLTVPSAEAELGADLLWGWGIVALEERDLGTGMTELWTALGELDRELEPLVSTVPGRWSWRFVDVDASVTETWRRYATATRVTPGLVCVPAWVGYDASPGETVLFIEPGPTFGLGDHPTTLLTLRALAGELAAGHGSRPRVLDVGCGSGVLAVAACRLGAAAAVAIDISPASPAITAANATRNGVAGMIEASCTPLGEVADEFDLVTANILAPVLIELAGDLRRVLAPGGVLILSGLLDGRYDHVLAALDDHGPPLSLVGVERLDGWVALVLR